MNNWWRNINFCKKTKLAQRIISMQKINKNELKNKNEPHLLRMWLNSSHPVLLSKKILFVKNYKKIFFKHQILFPISKLSPRYSPILNRWEYALDTLFTTWHNSVIYLCVNLVIIVAAMCLITGFCVRSDRLKVNDFGMHFHGTDTNLRNLTTAIIIVGTQSNPPTS